VSRGVHNIAFLLSPDRFRVFDLVFFILKLGLSIAKGARCLGNTCNTEYNTRERLLGVIQVRQYTYVSNNQPAQVTIKLSESGKIETSQKELETAEYQDSEGMLERKQATGKALPYKMGYAWRRSARDKTRVRMAAQCKDEARVCMVA
jgi:type II secretory pathway component PulJ